MKRIFSVLLSLLLLLSLCSLTAFAAEENDISKIELPAPKAPNYFVYTDGDARIGHYDDPKMIMIANPEVALLAAEYDRDNEAFLQKYRLYSFALVMQYDVSLDGETSWQYTSEWDICGLPKKHSVSVREICGTKVSRRIADVPEPLRMQSR